MCELQEHRKILLVDLLTKLILNLNEEKRKTINPINHMAGCVFENVVSPWESNAANIATVRPLNKEEGLQRKSVKTSPRFEQEAFHVDRRAG